MIRFYLITSNVYDGALVDATFQAIKGGTAGFPWHPYNHKLVDSFLRYADTDTAQHATITADPAVYIFPDSLDDTIPNAPSVRADLEPLGYPLSWITNGMTWRTIVRYLLWLGEVQWGLAQAGFLRMYPDGVTFNTTLAELDPAYVTAMQDAFVAIGAATDVFQPTATLREVLESLEAHVLSNSYTYRGVVV